MNKSSVRQTARKVRDFVEMEAERIYQRTDFSDMGIESAMKQILIFAEILGKLDVDKSDKSGILLRWNGYFAELNDAVNIKDYITVADIFHHRFVHDLEQIEAGEIK